MAVTKKKNQLDLSRQVEACLIHHLKPGARLRVALSGGVDSVVLLHLLVGIAPHFPLELNAMHVHHGLNPNADQWAEHCLNLCKALNIPCDLVPIKVPRKSSMGLEAAARSARYAALCQTGADAVALAHHLDDQAETVLFQLLRGGEPRALAAMPEARSHDGMLLLRPLLGIAKSELVDYARRHHLTWVEDNSNLDTSFSRNALRQEVLPVLEKHFPDYRKRLAGVARRMAEIAHLLEILAEEDKQRHRPGELDCTELKSLPEARARNLLAHFLRDHHVPVPRPAQLKEILRQLIEARTRLVFPLADGRRLERIQGKARIA